MIEVEREFHSNSKKKAKGKGRHEDIDEDDVIGRSNAALKDIGELWGGLEVAKIEMRDHDYHVSARSEGKSQTNMAGFGTFYPD